MVYGFNDTGVAVTGADLSIDTDLAPNNTMTGILATIQADIRLQGGVFADATVALTGDPGAIEVTLGTNTTASFTIAGTGGPASVGLSTTEVDPTDSSLALRVDVITADEQDAFLANSVAGGALTVYASNGAPANVQLRWAKIDQPALGGPDRWNLFYLTDGNATGSDPMWANTGQDYDFSASGSMSPNIVSTTLSGLTVNGIAIGDVTLQHGVGGVTQFADANGLAQVTALNQNGYAAGEYISVTVNESGRIVASYTNGQQVELAQIALANFNAPNSLKRLDGGLFAATSESGEAILGGGGSILGGSLESSNTDISEEFTKLITTQQAYAAGTRIVSTADEMLQEALNMIR